MNRHERRRAARMNRENKLAQNYVEHLPEVGPDHIGKGGVFYALHYHDAWCRIYDGNGGLKTCNCKPVIKYHAEPQRS